MREEEVVKQSARHPPTPAGLGEKEEFMEDRTMHETRTATDTSPAFERNLSRLLSQAYEQPEIRVAFRDDLLQRLKDRQRQNRQRRRHRVISLYGTLAAAASFCIVFGAQFLLTATPPTSTAADMHADMTTAYESPAEPAPHFVEAHRIRATDATTRQVSTASSTGQTALASLHRPRARAVEPLDFRVCAASRWVHLAKDESFTLVDGAEIRTPVGSLEPALVVIDQGPAVLLDGHTHVCLEDGRLRLVDGRTVVSVPGDAGAVPVQVGQHTLIFEPGTMAFLAVDESDSYADGGAPAPIVTILRGAAYPAGFADAPMLAGMVYHLYQTPTGRFPGRNLGENEYERFQPKMNVIQVANQY